MNARIACLGPEGTVSQEALIEACGDAEPDVLLVPTIHHVVAAVASGESDFALVPLENSQEGGVNETLDELLASAGTVPIVGELIHRVRHHLIAAEQLPLAQIDEVLSKPEAIAQCSEFLRSKLGRAVITSTSSTAEAVRTVADSGRPIAAIGTELAANLYGCVVLEREIGGIDNATRFIWLAANGEGESPPGVDPTAPKRTSIVFWGAGTDQPGWLVQCLAEFSDRGVNLTRIESRPRRDGLGSYVFFADIEGGAESEPVIEALEGLKSHAGEVRLLGSYPSGGEPPGG